MNNCAHNVEVAGVFYFSGVFESFKLRNRIVLLSRLLSGGEFSLDPCLAVLILVEKLPRSI